METQKIHKAMVGIMKAIEPIKKEKTNSQGGSFKYRGIDDVMNSLHEAFAENGVYCTTDVIDRKETERQSKSGGNLFYVTITVRFTFHADDGSEVSSTIYGTAMDSGDKADNKCLSIALKYCLLQAFLVPTEDMAEPDGQSHEVKPQAKQEQKLIPTEKFSKLCLYAKTEPDIKKVNDAIDKFKSAFSFNTDQTNHLATILTERK
jgi:hypothetical protein